MPALNFKKQFAPHVESGRKRQTIRAYRKDGRDPKPGQRLYLYTGMRTKECRKLKEAECKATAPIELGTGQLGDGIILNGRELDGVDRARVSRADGFACASEMLKWFKRVHGLPFKGLWIQW